MIWIRASIPIRGTDYVHYLLCATIHHAKLDMISRYGRRNAGTGKYSQVTDKPEFHKVVVMLHDGRHFSFIEMVCNVEHAQTLCYQKYEYKHVKKVWLETHIGQPKI